MHFDRILVGIEFESFFDPRCNISIVNLKKYMHIIGVLVILYFLPTWLVVA